MKEDNSGSLGGSSLAHHILVCAQPAFITQITVFDDYYLRVHGRWTFSFLLITGKRHQHTTVKMLNEDKRASKTKQKIQNSSVLFLHRGK